MSERCDVSLFPPGPSTAKAVTELLPLISDGGKGQKEEALARVALMGLESCYPPLEKAVRNDVDADLRNGAMEALVAFGEEAVPRLLTLLEDENEEVRNFSTVMLGDIGSCAAVRALSRALRDAEANVRHGAAEALAKIGDPRAVPPLLEMLQGDFWDQYYAIAALGELGDNRAIPPLLHAVHDEMLTDAVQVSLGKIRNNTSPTPRADSR